MKNYAIPSLGESIHEMYIIVARLLAVKEIQIRSELDKKNKRVSPLTERHTRY